MKSESKTGKIASFAILALVVVGAAAIMGVSEVSGKSIMSKAFVCFVSAVIVVQVVPGIMLLGAMLKAVCSMAGNKVALPVAANDK